MENNITDTVFWDSYWDNYRYDKIPQKVVFQEYVPRLINGESFIEIGGFPGIYASYFYRQGVKDVTVLDFHLNLDIVRNFEKINDLPKDAIKCIQSDFFQFESDRRYDIVFSSGFVEHFQDTRDVIARHVNLLSPKGQLLILIPNFLGLNGFVQRVFDKENLDAHNLQSMRIARLNEMMRSFGLRDVQVEYIGKPMLWLEPKPKNKAFAKLVKLMSYSIKIFPIKCRLLSPYIVIYGRE
ncbi:MAG: class I SAM-dependent methyltransferase [Dysgonamonadaceae bacterium]|jgi:2-polyprenyl-3-methyl-5-hydroxy-6-metoxy-1,4-benzoquinol methylase|nr:class I SAM-dependent methyltransferase [Dysgonamonadaceae bacterium]